MRKTIQRLRLKFKKIAKSFDMVEDLSILVLTRSSPTLASSLDIIHFPTHTGGLPLPAGQDSVSAYFVR
jgi:hypothetical protein